jgi:hypothetical protein
MAVQAQYPSNLLFQDRCASTSSSFSRPVLSSSERCLLLLCSDWRGWSHGFLPCSLVFVAEVSRRGRRWTCPGRRSLPECPLRPSTSPPLEVCARATVPDIGKASPRPAALYDDDGSRIVTVFSVSCSEWQSEEAGEGGYDHGAGGGQGGVRQPAHQGGALAEPEQGLVVPVPRRRDRARVHGPPPRVRRAAAAATREQADE